MAQYINMDIFLKKKMNFSIDNTLYTLIYFNEQTM